MAKITVTSAIALDEDELREDFARSSGPGGQNVNKVETAVQLRFDVAGSPSLPPAVKAKLVALAGSRLTKDGVLVIDARNHRTRERNREDARERLLDLIRRAAYVPKRRRATKPTAGSRERRLTGKRKRSNVKAGRGRVGPDD